MRTDKLEISLLIRISKKSFINENVVNQPAGSNQKDLWDSMKLLLGNKKSKYATPCDLTCDSLNYHLTSIGSTISQSLFQYGPIWKETESIYDFIVQGQMYPIP